MQQAILITAYKNIDHLTHIVDFFNTDNYTCYIHIDKKSDIVKGKIENLQKRKNVKLISQRYKVNWGGLNHLKAILLLLKEALKNEEAEYYHLITGHDYPIKSKEFFYSFPAKNKGGEFMEFNSLPYKNWPNGGADRLSLYNFYDIIDGRSGFGERIVKGLLKLQTKLGIKRSFSKDFPNLFGGSTYWTLSRQAIEYVFDYMQKHPDFFKRFKYSFCSEEIFFQTIIMNSPLKDNVVNNNLRFIVWEKRNGNFPANLDETDLQAIFESNALFARKFEYPTSIKLLEEIKSQLS